MKIGEILMARYISNHIYIDIDIYISSQVIDIEKTYPISH